MSAELDRLTQSVADLTTAIGSMDQLLDNLSQIIRDSVNDPAKLIALADSLDNERAKILAAITEHTPQAPPPTP